MSAIKSAKHAVVATDFRFQPGESRAVGGNGEINASSKKDLVTRSLALMQASANREVQTAEEFNARAAIRATNQQLVQAAFDDPVAHRVLGERHHLVQVRTDRDRKVEDRKSVV